MLSVGVMVSGGGTNLQNLIDGVERGEIPARIVAVVATNPKAGAIARAERHCLPVTVLRPKDFDDYGAALSAHFTAAGAELIVLAGCNAVLSGKLLADFAGRIINIHPALLPAFGGKGFYGLNVHKAVLDAGVRVTGATAHFVTDEVDAGAIIAQKAVAARDGDTPESLQRRVMLEAEKALLPQAVRHIAEGRLRLENGRVVRRKHVLVVGGGGREHAIVWKLAQSPNIGKIYCAPGNAGIARLAEIVDIAANDVDALTAYAVQIQADMVVIGPDDPLALGLADKLAAVGVPAFGPTQAAARLESSKSFAKDFMARHGIPTARHASFTDYDEAVSYIENQPFPLVVKADGLALGKGVTVCADMGAARAALAESFIDGRFGEAGAAVVIEECLTGREVSVLAFCDGETLIPMPAARDYKRAYDHDTGPNTGGMGAISPVPDYTAAMHERCTREIFLPTLAGLKAEGIVYQGVIYFGLMLTPDGPMVIEYNARFGDPETEALLPRLETDLPEIFDACIGSNLRAVDIRWKDCSAMAVVLAQEGYPASSVSGLPVPEADPGEGAVIFHAGTKLMGGQAVTAGGRVLCAVGLGDTAEQAKTRAYAAAGRVECASLRCRGDIGA